MSDPIATEADRRWLAAAIRYAERHVGLTATNPSVATLIVARNAGRDIVVGRGITALGGRPHAEAAALGEAGERARGATAYVTLEPCAHHGRTPPCAEALVAAGIARVVSASADPDVRVDGRGHGILRAAGLTVVPGLLAREAAERLSGYLTRHARNRPQVTLKIAVSRDGKIGRRGGGQVKITGPVADRQTHLVRAQSDAILVGIGTVAEDDPRLDCRLPGLGARSPRRIVLDPMLRLDPASAFARGAKSLPTQLAVLPNVDGMRRQALEAMGFGFLACETVPGTGRVALPELLEDLGATGTMTVLVEGGATIARSFLAEDLVDRLILVEGPVTIGADGVDAPVTLPEAKTRFRLARHDRFGEDLWHEFDLRGPHR